MPDPQISERAGCLDENTLALHLDRLLDPAEVAAVERHVDACVPCHRLLAAVARLSTPLEAATTDLPGRPDPDVLAARQLMGVRPLLVPGTKLGRYIVTRALGAGGMGVVYAARDPDLARDVALKVVVSTGPTSDPQEKRLLREARLAARLQHPSIVAIFDVGQVDDATYLAMELVSGRSLREYVGDASVPIERRIAWLTDVARALAAAHAGGLVHRDIKPENVMVADDGTIKVVDFGISRRTQVDPRPPGEPHTASVLTGADAIIGTPMYMAPEQLRNEPPNERSDQFAWGVLAYELLTGKRPWSGYGVGLISEILTTAPPR